MNKKALIIIIYNIIVVLSVMYATQPLQPLLAKEFSITMTQSSLFTAVVMFWLGIAPIIYGYILESMSSKKMLIVASVILFITNLILGFSNSFEMFLLARCVEGLVVPAILTSSMTILANIDRKNIQFNMSIYVASTVLGGLIGRVMSGFIATEFGWRSVFFSLSFALLISLYFIIRLKLNINSKLTKATFHDVMNILKDKRFVIIYIMMFTVFFVFAGLLNLMPFRMKELIGDVSESTIGLLYLGYGSGIVVALLSRKLVKFFGNEIKTILIGGVFYTVMILFFRSENLYVIFTMMFLLCIGMFTVHSISTGMANSMKEEQKGLTSGMYLTFYYIGGATGSIVPSMIYSKYGWESVITVFVSLLTTIFILLFVNKNIYT